MELAQQDSEHIGYFQSIFKSLCRNSSRSLKHPLILTHFLSSSLLDPYLFVQTFHTTLKKDPVVRYKDGRSNRMVTAVGRTIEASLEAGVRHRVRWGAQQLLFTSKRWSVHPSLLTTHTHRDANHTRTTLMLTPSCTSFFGVGVSSNKGHQSSSSGVFTLVWPRSTTPLPDRFFCVLSQSLLESVKNGNLSGKGGQCDLVQNRHACFTTNHLKKTPRSTRDSFIFPEQEFQG